MKVTELRAELEALGLDTKGKKADLETRLQTALEADADKTLFAPCNSNVIYQSGSNTVDTSQLLRAPTFPPTHRPPPTARAARARQL